MQTGSTVALIVAAGSGTRSGSATPKQFAPIAGQAMVAHAYAALSAHLRIDRVVVVIGEGQEDALQAAVGPVEHVIGGATRRESVAAGLAAMGDAARVLIHDAARPFVPGAVIDRLLEALDQAPGAVPVLPVADTLACGDAALGDVVPRDALVRVQTPQAFDVTAIRHAHREWDARVEATDDAQMLRAIGMDVAMVAGDPMLDKITYPADFALAEAHAVPALVSRSATGYDVHRLEAGEELWLEIGRAHV